jgi:hypothetical protein
MASSHLAKPRKRRKQSLVVSVGTAKACWFINLFESGQITCDRYWKRKSLKNFQIIWTYGSFFM